ncbi:MAG: tetratricopeptide repeat protein [Deltaproteobacteria bacterium]|nr:tetratricopeptide repeat protein [Deltaproteobacteria bacterium]
MGYRFSLLPIAYCLFFILFFLSILTYSRNLIWTDQFTLWSDTQKKSPNKARPYNDIGNVYLLQNKFGEAMEMYQKAISLMPDFYEAHYNLGIIYSRYGMWSGAIKEFRNALDSGGGGEYRIHYRLGDAFAGKGMFEDAIKEYSNALMLRPDDADVYYGLARVYSLKMEKDIAIDYLAKAIKNGFQDYEIMSTDKGLDNIRNDKRYKAIAAGKR